jgi:hypothetical protein
VCPSAEIAEHEEGEVEQRGSHPEQVEPNTGQDIDDPKKHGLRSWSQLQSLTPFLSLFCTGKNLSLRALALLSEDTVAHGLVGSHSKLILLEDKEDEEENGHCYPQDTDVPEHGEGELFCVVYRVSQGLFVGQVEHHSVKEDFR